ncbi:DUF1292 domain-containing protein [Anaerocolumna sedimenticola]|uniref:DUF1292 domain-containing protein n=1 Tax=Anaerocolumna sedimenticola TaxID=2696063 RepID=A0A6P1TP07_9FIRM|nr:DUF1292 domain-containing protein [Anaerocolumna sedimenticola]QHQ61939.1 DUF1292 domain-containing protein [Anaerocolumna sedimenticola]
MEEQKNKVIFTTEDNEQVEFYILEQTKLNGITYLLVTDSDKEEEEGTAYILKDLSKEEDESALYDIVDDENELESIAKIFEELLDDIDIET